MKLSEFFFVVTGCSVVSFMYSMEKVVMKTYVTREKVITYVKGGNYPERLEYNVDMPNQIIGENPNTIIDITGDDRYKKLTDLCPDLKENDSKDIMYVLEYVGERVDDKPRLSSMQFYTGRFIDNTNLELIPCDGHDDILKKGIRILIGEKKPINNDEVDSSEQVACLDDLINRTLGN